MEDITIIKKIGSGMFATVYLAEKDNKKYALKRQKILYAHMSEKNYKNSISKEANFYNWINKLNDFDQIHFMKLHEVKFHKCIFVHEPTHLHNDPEWQKKYKELNESPYCVDMLVDLKDGMLWELIINENLSMQQKYSIVIQILYAINLMHIAGYHHGDLHVGNIAYDVCDFDKSITIVLNDVEYQLPTFGHIISIIDYGDVMHNKFYPNEKEIKFMQLNLDIFSQIQLLLNFPLIFIKDKSLAYPQREKLLKYIFEEHYDIFIKMKCFFLSIYNCKPEYHKFFHDYENSLIDEKEFIINLKNDMLVHPFFNLFPLYAKKIFCDMLKINFVPNFIENYHIELILLNTFNQTPVIKFLFDFLKKK